MRWSTVSTLVALASVTVADQEPFIKSSAFDNGEFGEYPVQEYKTTEIRGPHPNFLAQSGSCSSDGMYVMTTPRGYGVPDKGLGPMITDEMGGLIWLDPKYQQPYNLAVQDYKGEKYLTFWAGDDGVRGHGSGVYYMLNASYDEVYRIEAANGLDGDLHEFRITDNNTVLITVYQIVEADLSSIRGPKNGWVWEGIFQEMDIETGEALFEWRASEHIGFDQSYENRCRDCGVSSDSAWDWFHINSVDKDPEGNYIISSRFARTVTHINGTTGEIIWVLGGKSNMFEDLSDGQVTRFASQHHARWQDDYTAITIFDNESPGPGLPSKGLYIDIDQEKMTVKLRHTYASPHPETTYSQGSVQILDNGHVVVGYGFLGQYTEFTMDGKPICDVHLGPRTQYGRGAIQSYRVGKFDWVGKPKWAPEINQTDGHLYMSWMGATEVAQWMIEQADTQDASNEQFEYFKTVNRNGFETKDLNTGCKKEFLRAAPLDKHGNRLGVTRTIARGPLLEEKVDYTKYTDPVITFVVISIMVSTAVTALVVIGLWVRRWLKYRLYARADASDKEKDDQQVDDAKQFELDDSDTLSLLSEENAPMMKNEQT